MNHAPSIAIPHMFADLCIATNLQATTGIKVTHVCCTPSMLLRLVLPIKSTVCVLHSAIYTSDISSFYPSVSTTSGASGTKVQSSSRLIELSVWSMRAALLPLSIIYEKH
jgi:hypothetical protein